MKFYDNQYDLLIETKIKPNIKMIYDMKTKGLSDKYISQALGITQKMFLQLMDKSELLKDTYDDAMMLLASQLNEIVFGRALGTDGRMDDKGNLLPPDEKMAFKLLEKFDSRYTNKVQVQETLTIETFIKKLTREEAEVIEDE